MTHDFNEIKEKIKELILTTPNITSVSYGHKISNGQQTGELSIIYTVKEKKSLSELQPNEVLPSEIKLSSGVIKTDVSVMSEVSVVACNAYCGQTAGANSTVNRSVVRPLKGGASITCKNLINYVGTMGFVAVDIKTQALVGVTNNHVVIQDAFYTSYRNLSTLIKNEYTPIDYVYQNGESAIIPPLSYQIGQTLRYVPIHTYVSGESNLVDCAMFSLESEDVSDSISFQQIGEEAYASPYPFATTAEIDNLLISNPMLYSSGRTTGPKGGSGCPLRVFSLSGGLFVSYTLQNVLVNTLFLDCITFVKPETDPSVSTICSNPIIAGDSGSALIADFSGVRKIIGLVFARADDGFYAVACRIDNVANELGIEAWDGTTKNYVNPNTIQYITTSGGSLTKTISCDDDDYWQVGLTNLNNVCLNPTP